MVAGIVLYTDCTDPNAIGRLSSRTSGLFGISAQILPLEGQNAGHAASLHVLDALEATEGTPHPILVMVNIAPRDGHWENGVPFCFVEVPKRSGGTNYLVSTWNPDVFDLIARYRGVTQVAVTDIRTVLSAAGTNLNEVNRVSDTQFRSLWYHPDLAKRVAEGQTVPAQWTELPMQESEIRAIPDNFGNCKLTVTGEEFGHKVGDSWQVKYTDYRGKQASVAVQCFQRLADVSHGQPGLSIGSSGPIGNEFVELAIRGGRASDYFGIGQGTRLTASPETKTLTVHSDVPPAKRSRMSMFRKASPALPSPESPAQRASQLRKRVQELLKK